jgi:pimeloyl-ACP methyl ester carboxylesterase
MSTRIEEAVAFENARGQRLPGVWHEAEKPCGIAIIALHGWTGYRAGPHQMLTRAARERSADFHVLRFDFAGRGDSEGDASQSTLATMTDDLRAAMHWCKREKNIARFLLLGLCSGCEIAFAGATENGVEGLVLWSAPVFAAAESDERKAQKRKSNMLAYAKKLFRPATYAKILGGKLDVASIKKALRGEGGEAAKNVDGVLPAGWKHECVKAFQKYRAPLFLVYGTADPTTNEALEWYRQHYQLKPDVHLVEGANHSYYGVAWEREVFAATKQWLETLAL